MHLNKLKKADIMIIDLAAAYNTVWHCGVHLKLLQTIQDRHIVTFIMEMLTNCSFTLHTSDGQQSRQMAKELRHAGFSTVADVN